MHKWHFLCSLPGYLTAVPQMPYSKDSIDVPHVFLTVAAADCEESTHEEERHTRLEPRGYLRCNPNTHAPNMRQAGVPYSEFETYLHTKQEHLSASL